MPCAMSRNAQKRYPGRVDRWVKASYMRFRKANCMVLHFSYNNLMNVSDLGRVAAKLPSRERPENVD